MEPSQREQRLSIISAVYNVERYLPDFLDSLSNQTFGIENVELIMVIDGSPDDSERILREWSEAHAPHAKIIVQENGGAGAARNTGLDYVTTDLVTFTDPDDVLHPKFIETVSHFLDTPRGQRVDMAVTNQLVLNDETGEVTNSHPLRVRFSKAIQVVELDRHPNYIHLQAASAFYRTRIIRENSIRFDVRVKPNFEDAHFTAKYLLKTGKPRVAFIRDAEYWYRKRTNKSSLIQTSWQKPEKFIDLPKYGYLALLRETMDEFGVIPEWLQNLVLYDIFWYMREDDRMHSAVADIPAEWAHTFMGYLEKIIELIDEHVIADFRVINTHWHHRQQLLQKFKKRPVQYTEVSVNDLDEERQIVRMRYVFSGEMPTEEFRARGYVVRPVHETTQLFTFLGQEMMYLRTAWLPATGTLALSLDGHRIPLHAGGFHDDPFKLPASRIWRTLANKSVPQHSRSESKSPTPQLDAPPHFYRQAKVLLKHAKGKAESTIHNLGVNKLVRELTHLLTQTLGSSIQTEGTLATNASGSALRFLVGLPATFEDFSDDQTEVVLQVAEHANTADLFNEAWVLIDRDAEAHDNAEHLYRYLQNERRDINAWFVLSPTSSDWLRLKSEGFRLIPHGSFEHLVLLLNAKNLISSQVDHYVVHPYPPRRFGKFPWKFTFLQHGVSTNEISRWLNRKPIDLLVTSSQLEYQEFVRHGSMYRFSTKDTALTGMPRFDRLVAESQKVSTRDMILIMPTWRRWLLGEELVGNERAKLGDFQSTKYARSWSELLNSNRFREFARTRNLNIAFMPHPNMRPYLEEFPKPDYVDVYSYHDTDVQELLVRASTIITDYSSVSFDGAYIGVPILYYQFDREEFFAGGHVAREGVWTYEKNGLGPIATKLDDLLLAAQQVAANNFKPSERYAINIRNTFPVIDSNSCRRVTDAIAGLHTPLPYEKAYRRIK